MLVVNLLIINNINNIFKGFVCNMLVYFEVEGCLRNYALKYNITKVLVHHSSDVQEMCTTKQSRFINRYYVRMKICM